MTYAVLLANALEPAAAWYFLFYLYFFFALCERKKEKQKKIKYRYSRIAPLLAFVTSLV